MPVTTIGFLTPLYFDDASCVGGGERYPLNLARAVTRGTQGAWRVELLSFGSSSGTRDLGHHVTLRILRRDGAPANSLDVISWEMPEAIAGCDLLHIHQPFTRCGELGLLLARQQGKPVCLTDHGGHSSRLGEEIGLTELADRLIAYSRFGAAQYRTRTPIAIIPGGVDCEAFSPAPAPTPRDHLLYVGRLLPHKGIDRLIEALPPELPLTVCGRAYHEAYLQRLHDRAKGKRVTFVTDADDPAIREMYRRAWATILPSVYRDCFGQAHRMPELMGLTLLESMACGTPAIATRVGGMPEFIDPEETGFIVDGDAELTRAIERVAHEPGLSDRLGRQARIAMTTRFGLDVVGRQLRELYATLLRVRAEAAA